VNYNSTKSIVSENVYKNSDFCKKNQDILTKLVIFLPFFGKKMAIFCIFRSNSAIYVVLKWKSSKIAKKIATRW